LQNDRRYYARALVIVAALIAVLAPVITDAQPTDETLVQQQYPAWLDDDYRKYMPDGTPARYYDFGRADLDGSGRADYIVAAYCNSITGVVRVLRSNGTPAADTDYPAMGGMRPSLRLIDVDNDGRMDVVAAFTAGHGSETWVFRWDGSQLVSVGPTSSEGGIVNTTMGLCDFLDVDGDGTLEAVFGAGRFNDAGGTFKLGTNGFTRTTAAVMYVGRYVRDESQPTTYTGVFPATKGQALLLTVVNGDQGNENQVTSGELYFNGKLLLSSKDFKKKQRAFSLTVVANELNEVEAELQGKPGTELTVTVVAAP
jgi:hypothetical protein